MTHADPRPFQVTSRSTGTAFVVGVAGEVDLLTAPQVEAAINAGLSAAAATLVLDLTDVSFLDSAGLAILARAQLAAGERVAFRVVATHPAILKPIRLTGMHTMLAMFDTVAAALAANDAGPTA